MNKNIYLIFFQNPKISPIWTRVFGLAEKNLGKKCAELMGPLFDIYGADKVLIGHTPQIIDGITGICPNEKGNYGIYKVDYGGSRAFNNVIGNTRRNAQVLEILNDGEQIKILKKPK